MRLRRVILSARHPVSRRCERELPVRRARAGRQERDARVLSRLGYLHNSRMTSPGGGQIPTPAEFRRRFPILEDKIFINSCSKGALSDRVAGAYEDYLRSWREEGSQWAEWMENVERVRLLAASLVGCSTREIAVSFSVSTAAAGIASALDFGSKRRKVLLGDFEFSTMAQIWRAQARRGATIVPVRAEGERLPAAAYEAFLDDETLIVPMAHLCFRNGFRQDVRRMDGVLSGIVEYRFPNRTHHRLATRAAMQRGAVTIDTCCISMMVSFAWWIRRAVEREKCSRSYQTGSPEWLSLTSVSGGISTARCRHRIPGFFASARERDAIASPEN